MGHVMAVVGCGILATRMCQRVLKVKNKKVNAEPNYAGGGATGKVYVLMCTLDYKHTDRPLTSSADGKNMKELIAACGVPQKNITWMRDEECTKENVADAIAEVGGKCDEDDYFIFYFSGHGTSMEDISGDEEDGQDEAFCLVTPEGQITYESCMTDDDFADHITSSVSEEANVIILTDCCHSGTIADFDTGDWSGRKAVSIAGCLDHQASGDVGKGGIFTHSMLMAVERLAKTEKKGYTVAKLYNDTLEIDEHVFESEQDICLQCSPGYLPNQMAWPLVPRRGYTAPTDWRPSS